MWQGLLLLWICYDGSPLPSASDSVRCITIQRSSFSEEGTEAQAKFLTQGIMDERVQTRGFWPQSPAPSTTPCCHYFTLLGWGRATRRPSAVWKNQVCTRFEVCPHRVLTAQVSFCLALELESRLPIQPGNGPRIQTGKHFCQKGNWFSLKKFSRFCPCPLSQITPPLDPSAETIAVSGTYFLWHLESLKCLRFTWTRNGRHWQPGVDNRLREMLTNSWGVRAPI